VAVPGTSDTTTDPFVGSALHERVSFVRGDFDDPGDPKHPGVLTRTNVAKARTVIIDLPDANAAYVLVDHIREVNPNVHVIVGLENLAKEKLFRNHTGVVCVQRGMWQLMAEEAEDPGMAHALTDLMTDADGANISSMPVPEQANGSYFSDLRTMFGERHNAALVMLCDAGQLHPRVPVRGHVVRTGDRLFYINAGDRLDAGEVFKGYVRMRGPVLQNSTR
jgi:Trk K+ transport system NAD-binding subunit